MSQPTHEVWIEWQRRKLSEAVEELRIRRDHPSRNRRVNQLQWQMCRPEADNTALADWLADIRELNTALKGVHPFINPVFNGQCIDRLEREIPDHAQKLREMVAA